MKEKRLIFPFCSDMEMDDFLLEFPKRMVKDREEYDAVYDLQKSDPLQTELKNHFPYKCYLNDAGRIEDWKIGFVNRQNDCIYYIRKKENVFWHGFEGRFFNPELLGFDIGFGKDIAPDETECKSFFLYSGANEPWHSQQNFSDYMNKLSYLETLLKTPSPSIQRIALLLKVAYSTVPE